MIIFYKNEVNVLSPIVDGIEQFYFNVFFNCFHEIIKNDDTSHIYIDKNDGVIIKSGYIKRLYCHFDEIQSFLKHSGLLHYISINHIVNEENIKNISFVIQNDYLLMKIKDEYNKKEDLDRLSALIKLNGIEI